MPRRRLRRRTRPRITAEDHGGDPTLGVSPTERVLTWAADMEAPGPGRDGGRYVVYCNDGRRVCFGPVPPGRMWRAEVGLIALDDANRSWLVDGTLLPREYDEGRLHLTLVRDPASGRYVDVLVVDRNAPLSRRVRREASPRLGTPDWFPVARGWVRPLLDVPTGVVPTGVGGPGGAGSDESGVAWSVGDTRRASARGRPERWSVAAQPSPNPLTHAGERGRVGRA